MKPVWALAGIALLGTAGAAGVLVVASSGGEEEVVQQVETPTTDASVSALGTPDLSPTPAIPPPPTPGPGSTLWRWVKISISIPDGSDLGFSPAHLPPQDNPPDGGPAVELTLYEGEVTSNLWIDAETGIVLVDNVRGQDRAIFDEVLKTLVVGPLDAASASWPYSDDLASAQPREVWGKFSFVRPVPATGLFLDAWIADPCGVQLLSIKNGPSSASVRVDEATGTLKMDSEVLPEDQAVFDRWFAEVCPYGRENGHLSARKGRAAQGTRGRASAFTRAGSRQLFKYPAKRYVHPVRAVVQLVIDLV